MKLDIYKQKWIDMVFEGRNKSYGAYNLRKQNPKDTLKGFFIGAVAFAGLLSLPLINWEGSKDEKETEKVTMVEMADLPPPPEEVKPLVPPPPPPPPAPKIDEVKFVKPKVVEKEKVVEEIKSIEELKDKNVGAKDIKGEEGGKIVIDAPSGDGPQTDQKIVEDNQIYNAVEVKPDFPGGIQKFYDFVGKNYKVPEEEDIKGKVFVQFVVEKDGTLTDIKVIRDLGFGTGKEAIRVLKKSPKWKPGIQNGRPVRVLYSLPISIVSGN